MYNDNLIREPFTRTKLEEETDNTKGVVMTIRLNAQEVAMLQEVKEAIQQPKDSTAIKTMFYLAYNDVLHDKKTKYLLETLFKNKRNNTRLGVVDFE